MKLPNISRHKLIPYTMKWKLHLIKNDFLNFLLDFLKSAIIYVKVVS